MRSLRVIAPFILTIFFIGLSMWFVGHEQAELRQVKGLVLTSDLVWMTSGIVLSVVYVFIHGLMYRSAFAAVGSRVSVWDGTILYLKRNFVSVFLPAGGVSSLAFFSADIEKKGVDQAKINFASSIYGFVGILSVVVMAVPVFIYALFRGSIGYGEWLALLAVVLLIAGIYSLYTAVVSQGRGYRLVLKYIPMAAQFSDGFTDNSIAREGFLKTLAYSLLIELVGIVHIYIAMKAIHVNASMLYAIIAYIIAVVFLVVSPFLRGLGAVEASMTFMLIRLGYSAPTAVSITFVYRFMEFWIPMLIGALSFLLMLNKLLMRVLPAILLLVLGLTNIISVLTPAIHERLSFLKDFLPVEAIRASNYFVFASGLFLLVTAAFMLKGLRTAWYFALGLCILSLIGHLSKAIDYEEASFAMLVIIILLVSRKEYYIKVNPKTRTLGVQTTLLSIAAVLLYGVVGFYFLDRKHFNIDFSWLESARYTLANFFLVGDSGLVANDNFARAFLYSINISGFLSIAFLVHMLIRPYISDPKMQNDDLEWAKEQLIQYGNSALDYFKTYDDKLIYREEDGFIAYRISGTFAVVLDCPVTVPEKRKQFIRSFDRYCFKNGLKSLYYRVPEDSLTDFLALKKKRLFLGQEGVVDLSTFTLAGRGMKSVRNAIKKVAESGFHSKIYRAPIKDGLLQKLQSVSDEWLKDTGREEIVFSQGMFVWGELKNHTIITVENEEEKVIAFLNIIPDYNEGEATYDLIRKTADAPNGMIDFIMTAMFEHLKSEGYRSVNIGFAPMSGLDQAKNLPEKSMKFAYEKVRSFSHYKGLRDAKEKFSPIWYNRYLIYGQDYDLLQVPAVLNQVIKP